MPEGLNDAAFIRQLRKCLPSILPGFLRGQRWFAGKADTLRSIEVAESIVFRTAGLDAFLFLVRVQYTSGGGEQYALPLKAVSTGQSARVGEPNLTRSLVLDPQDGSSPVVLSDALEDGKFAMFLLQTIRDGTSVEGERGELVAAPAAGLRVLTGLSAAPLEPAVMRVEQSNTSINYGGKLMLKFFRRVEEGINPDFETGKFLTEKAHFENTPPAAGSIEYRRAGRPPVTLAILQGFAPNRGDAWKYTLESLDQYFKRTAAIPAPPTAESMSSPPLLELAGLRAPRLARELIGSYFGSAALLGRRTAEMHIALSSDPSDPEFAPEAFSHASLERLSTEMAGIARHAVELLQDRMVYLNSTAREKAQKVILHKEGIMARCHAITTLPITALRTRVHGDYHLGQVLYTGTDFVMIDFEGEPERPLTERRMKHSPLRDVAGMLRSFHYAAHTALRRLAPRSGTSGTSGTADPYGLWARYWRLWVSGEFVRSYLDAAGTAGFIPKSREELRILLDGFLLEKALYEIIYELKNRPDWVAIPLDGIQELHQACG